MDITENCENMKCSLYAFQKSVQLLLKERLPHTSVVQG